MFRKANQFKTITKPNSTFQANLKSQSILSIKIEKTMSINKFQKKIFILWKTPNN